MWRIRPLSQRQAGAGVELITVGRDDQRLGVARPPGENNQAHKAFPLCFVHSTHTADGYPSYRSWAERLPSVNMPGYWACLTFLI